MASRKKSSQSMRTFDRHKPFSFEDSPSGYDRDMLVDSLPVAPKSLLGFNIDFPLGVPASAITCNHKYIKMYASLGFDILTYKTVRTREHPGHPFPNWAYVTRLPGKFECPFEEPVAADMYAQPQDAGETTMVNSFGIASRESALWQGDIQRAKEALRPGHQVLMVSVVASPDISPMSQSREIEQDFVSAGVMAKEAGADIVEVNYSCPNTPGNPDIYQDPEMSARISKAMYEALRPTPVVMKIGYLPHQRLREIVSANIGWVQGIVAINSISAPVKDSRGGPFFGENRPRAGVSGAAIKPWAMEMARNLADLKSQGKWGDDKIVLAVGGVTTPGDVGEYLGLGVDGVLSCTGTYANPRLAMEARQLFASTAQKSSYDNSP